MSPENKTVVWIRRQIIPADIGSESTSGGILSIQKIKSAQKPLVKPNCVFPRVLQHIPEGTNGSE